MGGSWNCLLQSWLFFLLTTLWLFICLFLPHLGEPCTGTSLPLRKSRQPRSAVTKVNDWLLRLVIVKSNPFGDPNINITGSVLPMFTDLLLIYVTLIFKGFIKQWWMFVLWCPLMRIFTPIVTFPNSQKSINLFLLVLHLLLNLGKS